MSVSRVIEVSFGNETVVYVNIDTAYYYNDGVIIKPTDGDLPDTYQVHWADSPEAQTTLETIGTPEGVPVPDELWGRSKVIYGWFYLHPTEDSSVTYKEIRIYKSARAGLPDGTEPTPSEHSTIDQLISAMNTAADKAEQNADSASSDADRAETARNEAETYATNAQTSASNAEASATTATNQAQIATTSATTATTAAQTATTKATEASDSASSAAESASSASDSADSASRSEQAAKISETNAADSESNASTYANSARGYAQTAQSASASASSSATSASNSANSASNSATSASQSASVATEAKADIEDMVESAKGYANASATNAASASRSADQAESAATNAATFATNAGNKAVEAAQSANTASSKATEASTSAQTASQKATEASQSASQALSYKNDAESAKTASQTAQGLAESARDSAITAKNEASQIKTDVQNIADGIDTRLVDVEDALIEKAPIITDTASGAIASFSDGADDLPLKSLVVNIEPVQDLHGQTNPYPAGGGKNKCDGAAYSCAISSNIAYILNRTPISSPITTTENYMGAGFIAPVKAGQAYAMSSDVSGSTSLYWAIYASLDDITDRTKVLQSGVTRVTFTANYDGYVVFMRENHPTGQTVTWTYAQIELGSSATAWSPYENICPISGWTQVNVEQRGKNLLKNNATNGSANGVTWTINSDGSILFSGTATATTDIAMNRLPAHLVIGKGQMALVSNGGASYNPTITGINFQSDIYVDGTYDASTLQNGKTKRTFSGGLITVGLSRIRIASGTVIPSDTVFYPQIEIGNAPSAYEPYTGHSINIQLGQTVYGGKLDVLTGKLTVYPYYASYNGETLTGEWISDRDAYAVGTTPTIGAQVVNIGAQGVTVQLEPHEVESLYGVNNLWADSGDTEVEYRADTKLFIERLTAPDSADMIADANITSGQYFMVGNSLYKATANIANGSAIVVGTNCIRKSLSEALNEINA